jgi:hypothetical protein
LEPYSAALARLPLRMDTTVGSCRLKTLLGTCRPRNRSAGG